MNVNAAPLGFFDSGVGGLTVVRAVLELLPAEDILYLGDTARLPYSSKSPETIRQFTDEDSRPSGECHVLHCMAFQAAHLHRGQEGIRSGCLTLHGSFMD